ncbi:MAG TPA: penicillin acylase family protein, partial [Spirochaetota bacterium]|nr:penicillin acylase family protein [Spirochaetota bacterium]
MRIRKRYIFIAAFAVLTAFAAYFIINIRFQTKYSGVIEGESSSQIIIERSEFGCPIVHVDNREDMFYALGFLHAQDRLPLMEYLRMLTDDSISFDDDEKISELKKIIRRTGLKHYASICSENISDSSKSLLDSYIKGINNYKNKFSYKKTASNDYSGNNWTNEDVIALFYLLEFSGRFINYRELSVAMPEEKKVWADELFGKENSVVYAQSDSEFVNGFRKISERLENAIGRYGEGFVYFSSINSEKIYGLKLMSSSVIYPLWYPVRFEMNGKY